MKPTPAVTRSTAVLVPCGRGLARMAITTARATPGELALKDSPVRFPHARGTQGTADFTKERPGVYFYLARHRVYPLYHV